MIMKQVTKYFSIGLTVALALTSCSDKFLEDKKNYDNAQSDIYNYYSGASARLADLYSWCLPSVGDIAWNNPSMGSNDMCAKATEEYAGLSDLVDPEIELVSNSQTNSVPDFFQQQQNNIQASVYGRIRNVNDCIEGIEGSTLTTEQKNDLLGQCYFLRAWCYYNLFKWYGGVPLVKATADPVAENVTPRATSKETKDFIIEDLEKAVTMLGTTKASGTNYGRVTGGTALALKGRVLLLWASPLFNRASDKSRWTTAYETMKEDLDGINACGYGLYTANSSGAIGGAFAEQFLQSTFNQEAIFMTLYNQVANDDGLDVQKNNSWERGIRPSNTGGSGKTASAYLINLFPMEDGRRPSNLADANANGVDTYTKLEVSGKTYNPEFPFVDRDPRFYHTFGFPGFRWAYSGDASLKDARNPSDGANYTLWNYVWYVDKDDEGNIDSGNSFGADNLFSSKCGVYVRKKSDDLDINTKPLYQYMATYTKGAAPFFSAAPLIEIRYAEVLLNLAEAACMSDHMDEAVTYLQQIRARAGYTAINNYGLQADLATDKATCMSAILYERQIEFAYEGKRFDDMRRWLLFDGGAGLASLKSSWALSGEITNTCTWLGVTPFNGQSRYNIEFRTANKYGVGGKTQEASSDPLVKAGVVRPDGVDLRNADALDDQISTLQKWYAANLKFQRKRGDGYYQTGDNVGSDKVVNFRAKYYFFGLSSGAQSGNKALPQTIGWEATVNEATFDPLAE